MNTSQEIRKVIDALVCAALEAQDLEGLTPDQHAKAEQIYMLVSSLESDLAS
jgi:hypothetical protein